MLCFIIAGKRKSFTPHATADSSDAAFYTQSLLQQAFCYLIRRVQQTLLIQVTLIQVSVVCLSHLKLLHCENITNLCWQPKGSASNRIDPLFLLLSLARNVMFCLIRRRVAAVIAHGESIEWLSKLQVISNHTIWRLRFTTLELCSRFKSLNKLVNQSKARMSRRTVCLIQLWKLKLSTSYEESFTWDIVVGANEWRHARQKEQVALLLSFIRAIFLWRRPCSKIKRSLKLL